MEKRILDLNLFKKLPKINRTVYSYIAFINMKAVDSLEFELLKNVEEYKITDNLGKLLFGFNGESVLFLNDEPIALIRKYKNKIYPIYFKKEDFKKMKDHILNELRTKEVRGVKVNRPETLMSLQGYVKLDREAFFEPFKNRIIKVAFENNLDLLMTSKQPSIFKQGVINYEVTGLREDALKFDELIATFAHKLRWL